MSPPLPRPGPTCELCPHNDKLMKLDKIERDLDTVVRSLVGDLDNPQHKGLLSRVAELEEVRTEHEESRKFLVTTAVGAAITSVIGAIGTALIAFLAWALGKGAH